MSIWVRHTSRSKAAFIRRFRAFKARIIRRASTQSEGDNR